MINLKHKPLFNLIFSLFATLILFTVIASLWMFIVFFDHFYQKSVYEKLQSNNLALQHYAAKAISEKKYDSLNASIKEFTAKTNIRVTVTNPKGTVLADSKSNSKEMENHLHRPEINAALAQRKGTYFTRYSATMEKETIYFASPLEKGGKLIAVLRTAITVDSTHRLLHQLYIKIISASLIIAFLAACFVFITSKKLTAPLLMLRDNAINLAKGNFKRKPINTKIEEINELSISMIGMSNSLQNKIDEIERRKEEAETILLNMKEGIIALDDDLNITTINEAAKKNLEITGIAKGKHLNELVRYSQFVDFVKEISQKSSLRQRIKLPIMPEKILDVRGTTIKDTKKNTFVTLIVLNDITQMILLENMRKEFAANVSHELKTPLTAIKGAAETLINGVTKEKASKHFLKIIEKHANRLHALINDIMSLSKLEQDDFSDKFIKEKRKILTLMKSSKNMCEEKALKKKIKIEIQCKKNVFVEVNGAMIEQLLINLIDNAIKFSPKGSIITVSATFKKENFVLEVTDHGCGIPEEHIPRLFERFYRVEKGRSRNSGGTGLGLSIVKHITQIHNGTVSVKSIPEKETTFTVKLPLS
ncbi:MAG: ATP-binding protein [Verrucomicrobiota bacterium]|nr:ATP-binding protein [Verrucomicrobiota bacterium]